MDTVAEDDLAIWLERWLDRRSPAIVVRPPSGERIPTGEHWTPKQSTTVHQRALNACARALQRVSDALLEAGSPREGQNP